MHVSSAIPAMTHLAYFSAMMCRKYHNFTVSGKVSTDISVRCSPSSVTTTTKLHQGTTITRASCLTPVRHTKLWIGGLGIPPIYLLTEKFQKASRHTHFQKNIFRQTHIRQGTLDHFFVADSGPRSTTTFVGDNNELLFTSGGQFIEYYMTKH